MDRLLNCAFVEKDVLLQNRIKTILLGVDNLSIKVILNSFRLVLLLVDDKIQALNLLRLTLYHVQERLSLDVEIDIQF